MPFKKRNMKQTLKENGGLPASILWTLSIVAGITVANLYYNQPLLNMIRQDLHVSEVITNLIAMVTQIRLRDGAIVRDSAWRHVPTEEDHHHKLFHPDHFSTKHSISADYPHSPDRFPLYRYLFGNATDFHTDSRIIFKTRKQRAECRASCLRPVNRNTGLTGNQRNRRRNIRMAGDVLYCNRLDGCLCHRHNTGITGNTTDI